MINYYLLTKPGIIVGNLFTFAAGFLLASKGEIDLKLFVATLMGLGFIIASACVFNNYIDRYRDQKMERTKNRPLAKGAISGRQAILFAIGLGFVGQLLLFLYTNSLAMLIADFGFFVYVVLYSLWKGRTIFGTAIGSVAGATPPVVGYVAVSNQLDAGAWILFAMMVLWQMPHFYSIAVYHLQDYQAANIPTLPVKKGLFRTKIHMVLYIIGFIVTSTLLTFFSYRGELYLAAVMSLGLAWLAICLAGFRSQNDQLWGRRMFRFSLWVIAVVCAVISLET